MLCNSSERGVRKVWEKQPCRHQDKWRREGGAPDRKADVSPQPVEEHVRADIHAAARGEPPKEQVGMPWRKLQLPLEKKKQQPLTINFYTHPTSEPNFHS